MKKIIALILGLAMIFCLAAGCSSNKITQYEGEDETTETAVEPDPDPAITTDDTADTETTVTGLGLGGTGLETYDPDTVVATINGSDVTWREYYYWMNYDLQYLQYYLYYYYGVELTDWDAYEVSSEYTNAEVVMLDAQYYITEYHAMETGAADLGITLSEEDEAELEAIFEEYADANGDADGECTDEEATAYEELLEEQGVDRALYDYFNSVSLLSDDTFVELYGENGELCSDEVAEQFVEDNEIYAAKHILLMTIDSSTGEALDDDAIAEKLATAEDIVAQLQSVADDQETLVAQFDDLMAKYTEDTGYAAYPDGYVYVAGTMVSAFEDAVESEEDYEVSDVVESDYGYHIIMRIPVDLDAAILNYGYSPRFYAANQQFSAMIEAWVDAADVVWTEGFDDLDVAAILG